MSYVMSHYNVKLKHTTTLKIFKRVDRVFSPFLLIKICFACNYIHEFRYRVLILNGFLSTLETQRSLCARLVYILPSPNLLLLI